jgi:branched-subunit amino acid aminotransferase/4-amino-4-deoxychorismate lyase
MQAHLFEGESRFKIQFLSDHYLRLCASAAVLGIDVPSLANFETGLILSIEKTLRTEQPSPNQRLYLRSLHFSGTEDIFPRSGYPFFCNIFARPVPKPSAPVPLQILADRTYCRAPSYSRLGAAKCAVNYTGLVELANQWPSPPTQQRLWVSPHPDHAIEELDTMAVGLMLADGTFWVPPPSDSKLPSITMKRLLRRLAPNGGLIRSSPVGLEALSEQLQKGEIVGLFAASTGKGIGIATQIQIGEKVMELSPPQPQVDALWNAYVQMHEGLDRPNNA